MNPMAQEALRDIEWIACETFDCITGNEFYTELKRKLRALCIDAINQLISLCLQFSLVSRTNHL